MNFHALQLPIYLSIKSSVSSLNEKKKIRIYTIFSNFFFFYNSVTRKIGGAIVSGVSSRVVINIQIQEFYIHHVRTKGNKERDKNYRKQKSLIE